MADNRFNQASGFGGSGGFHIGQQSPSMTGLAGMAAYIPGGIPVSPMMQQQMMMASRMRSPMQGMMMGVPVTPPPPYSIHTPNPGVTSIPNRPRTLLSKSKEGQQSEKERYFEEQRQKLRLFGKPGTVKVDADKLIGTMFAADVKTQHSKAKSKNTQKSQDDDDGFGDFLQGPSLPTNVGQKDNHSVHQLPQTTDVETAPEPRLESSHEKKDLKSMMLEYSDLSAPKKAKGFHKLTLNEVHKSGQSHHKVTNFHESDHSRSWKQNTEDLEGLFHIPVTPKPTALPVNPVSPETQHLAYTPQQVMAAGLSPTGMVAFTQGYQVLVPPSGQPPSYSDVIGGVTSPTSHTAMYIGSTTVSHPGSSDLGHSSAKPTQLPGWCSQEEDQLPPVYKQVFEASLIEGKISTERLYPILLLSGLPREKLAQIWSLCNTFTPGQLTKHELWLVLALIALTQNNYDSSSRDILARCPVAPVPFFAQMQDTSAPATLPIGPQQYQSHPPHHSAATLATSPTTTHAPLPSHTPHQKPQFHRVQHSKTLPHKASPNPADATSSKNAGPTDEDDDFADFQAAAPTTNTAAVCVGKDEVFGEFIGGGVGNSGFSLLSPVAGPVHMGNGSVVMGNGSLHHHQPNQQQLRQPQEAQQQTLPAPLLLASLPVDDKYGTNVRSFFCSSDSSTGHTSPSFEDDDFTDGRDSLSQVSTSEQSENEDIRNFENYVEEYNQQMEKPSASPLHCPFPALQQSQTAVGTKRHAQTSSHASFDDAKHSDKDGGVSKFYLNAPSQGQMPGSKHTNISAGLNHHMQNPTSTDLKNAVSSLKVTSTTTAGASSLKSIKELADSKSAFHHATLPSDVSSSNEVSLIGDEDKYSALRVLSLDNDFSQHSTVMDQSHILGHSTTSGSNSHESNLENSPGSQEDDWADFSAAPAINDDQLSHVSSLPSAREAGASSDQEVSTGSMFDDDSSSSATPSKGWGFDCLAPGDGLSFKGISHQDSSLADGVGDGRYHRSEYSGHLSSLKDGSIAEVGTSEFPANSGLSTRLSVAPSVGSDIDNKLKYEDSWGKFPQNSSANNISFGKSSQSVTGRDVINGNIDESYSDVKTIADEDDWCDFSSAGAGDGAANADEVEAGDGRGKFVTIKKQNLGTSEIMGLFKVRDDPATLSSYQLPPQQQASKMVSSQGGQGSHHTGASSLGHRRSSDFDDDLCPPPMDMSHDDDYDDHSYSRGYDLDDFIQRMPTTTAYIPFGGTHVSPLYSHAGSLSKLKESKEDSASVHSLDLPSSRPTNRSSSDSQSVSSADLTSAEMAGVGVVSVESKSLDSLDLRSDNGDVDSIDGGTRDGVQTLGPASHHQPIQPQELLATMPDFADRYNIEREAQGSDRYGYEWERCLSNCCRMISEANMLFNMIDSSSVCNEVLKSTQGSEYVMCIIEIYRVVCRVMTSMRVTAISTTELEQTLKNIDIAWNNLSAFLVGTSLLPEQMSMVFTNCILKSDSVPAHSVACGLCLLDVDAKPLVSSSQPGSTSSNISICKLTYAGRQYHATCANFWVNCVDQTLPSLTLSDLL